MEPLIILFALAYAAVPILILAAQARSLSRSMDRVSESQAKLWTFIEKMNRRIAALERRTPME